MPVQKFKFQAGYYFRMFTTAFIFLIIGVAAIFGSLYLGNGLDIIRWAVQLAGSFFALAGLLGIFGSIIGILLVSRAFVLIESDRFKVQAGSRSMLILNFSEISGLMYDYESIVPSKMGLRFKTAQPTALRLITPVKTYLLLSSRMHENDFNRMTRILTEQSGHSIYKPKIGPEIATFPAPKYERGVGGWLVLTPAFLVGYKDTAARNPVLREGVTYLFIATNQIKTAMPASDFDKPHSGASGRTALLRLTLPDNDTRDVSLGFAARTDGPDYRKVLQNWVAKFPA